jgi:hypothetical protein
MRYAASEKLEILRLVEESHLSARLTLAKLGNPPDDVLSLVRPVPSATIGNVTVVSCVLVTSLIHFKCSATPSVDRARGFT